MNFISVVNANFRFVPRSGYASKSDKRIELLLGRGLFMVCLSASLQGLPSDSSLQMFSAKMFCANDASCFSYSTCIFLSSPAGFANEPEKGT